MRVVGLTGGIGSGKSTVAAVMAEAGATVIDADDVARQVVEPGGPARAAVLERFGTLDRAQLARMVFGDAAALADLNAIVHPAVRSAVTARVEELSGAEGVLVLVVPLLVESASPYPIDVLVVVDAAEEVAMARLVAYRGMEEMDARRRIGAQAGRQERRAAADFVIVNEGSREQLRNEVQRIWPSLVGTDR